MQYAAEGSRHQKTVGAGGGQQNVVPPVPWLLLVRQVQKMTGREGTMVSILVLAQDGRTTLLRTLLPNHGVSYNLKIPLLLLEYSRRFHIYDSCTTRKVWIRIAFVWKVFGSMDVEAMVCKDEWLGAAEMF